MIIFDEMKTQEFFKFLRGILVKHHDDTKGQDLSIEDYLKELQTEQKLSEMLFYFIALEKEVDELRLKLSRSESKRVQLRSGVRVLKTQIESLKSRVYDLMNKNK